MKRDAGIRRYDSERKSAQPQNGIDEDARRDCFQPLRGIFPLQDLTNIINFLKIS